VDAGAGADSAVVEPTTAWAEQSLDVLTSLPGVRRAGLAVIEGGGRRLDFTSADHTGQRPATWCQVDAYDDVPLNTAVRSGRAVVGTLVELEDSHPAFVQGQDGTGTLALAAVPLVAAGRTVGAFVLFYREPPGFADTLVHELVMIGARLGEALRTIRVQEAADPDGWMREPAPGALVVQFVVAGDPAAVGPARQELRGTLTGWGFRLDVRETAALCLSELVTNAVVHAGSGCHVQVANDDGTLTVEVRNAGSPRDLPPLEVRDPMRVHGRGHELVDALASQWGAARDGVGFSAWFVLRG
jgi:anti-sigma regulatory factor (Ser/Thr protein kinase)